VIYLLLVANLCFSLFFNLCKKLPDSCLTANN